MPHQVYHTPLVQKLGIKPGHAVRFVGAPDGFGAGLGLPDGVRELGAGDGDSDIDVAVLFARAMADVSANFEPLAAALASAGGLWVAYPKQAAKVPTDVTFAAVQALGLAAGLVDNKTCSVDEVFTAVRFVYRVQDRPRRSAGAAAMLLAALGLVGLAAGCRGHPAPTAGPAATATATATAVAPLAGGPFAAPTAGGPAVPDAGDLRLEFRDARAPEHQRIRTILEQSTGLAGMVARFNATFALPRDIPVVFEACDEENAYFDEETGAVQLCYELVDRYQWIFTDEQSTADEVRQETEFAAYFTLFHELGHALIHYDHLPVTGNEEDAADNFATLFLIAHGDIGSEAALAAADQFEVDHEDAATESTDVQDLPYWDEHALDAQRMYGVLCLVYGADATTYDYLVQDGLLPEERAEICADEYAQKSEAWATLLSPYLIRR